MAFIDLKPGSPNVPTAAQAKDMRATQFARKEPVVIKYDDTDDGVTMLAEQVEHCIIFIDGTIANVTINFPVVTTALQTVHWKRTDSSSNVVTFDPNGAELIEGGSTFAPPPGSSGTIQSDGTAWWITAFSVDTPIEFVS